MRLNKKCELTKEQVDLIKQIIEMKDLVLSRKLRETLELSEDFTYGFEIEEFGLNSEKLKKKFEEIKNKLNYDGYQTKSEISLADEYDEYGRLEETDVGGEISTPVFTDNKKVWEDLIIICEFLKKYASISDRCSIHINIGAHILGNDYKTWYNFCRILGACEPEIYKFFARGNKIRECAISGLYRNKFAMPISMDIRNGLNNIPKDNDDIEKLLIACNFDGRVSRDGKKNIGYEEMKDKSVSLVHIFSIKTIDEQKVAKLNYESLEKFIENARIEFRMGNGTFEVKEIQDGLDLISKIVDRTKNLTKEHEKIIDKLLNMTFPVDYNKDISIKRAILVANLLFDETKDKICFLSTYLSDDEKKKILENPEENLLNFDE